MGSGTIQKNKPKPCSRSVKVGDLIQWENKKMVYSTETVCGIVLRLSRTGRTTKSAEVLFENGDVTWIDCHHLEVINESR